MSDSDQDQNNHGEEEELSKLPKPASLHHYFGKVEANPKPWQMEAKIRPNPLDKNTKLTVKANSKRFLDWSWLNNSRMKFETKEGKTKISINTKMFQNTKKRADPMPKQEEVQNFIDQLFELERQRKSRDDGSRSKDGQTDVNFSTSFDSSKINVKLKDRGEINFKYVQAIELVPNTLSAQLDMEASKYSAELMYTTGVARRIYEKALAYPSQNEEPGFKPTWYYHKNERKVKAKVSTYADTQLKITSIHHFGNLQDEWKTDSQKEAEGTKREENQVIQNAEQPEDMASSSQSPSQGQVLKAKLQVEKKLTILKKHANEFNFKTSVNVQSTAMKQSFKIEAVINQNGLHNVEGRYIWKRWAGCVLGGMVGLNRNTHASEWHRKWEAVVEKQGFLKFANIALSCTEKNAGIKIMKKLSKNSKIQLIASRKWGCALRDAPNLGVKLSLNW